jgi:broad specificity phosphatase PhoE
MRLMLVRHGATANNAQQRYTGHSDIPLSPLGLRQAAALAAALAAERFDLILSSDLARAQQTAEAIAARNAAPLRLDADLREMAMGTWEGRTRAETVALEPEAWARWWAQPDVFPPPGGETLLQLRDRAARAFDRCYAEHAAGNVLWVTHGALTGVLLCHLLGIDLAHRWQFRRDNAGITELEVGPDRRERGNPAPRMHAILLRLNDTSHLKDLEASDLAEPSQVL